MKKMALFLALLSLSSLAFALPMQKGYPGLSLSPYSSAEMAAAAEALGSRPFGELTIAELTPYLARIELAARKDAWLKMGSAMSMHVPGAGQLRNGDTLAGLGYLTLHLATVAGTLVGYYFLLPSDLQFDKLDYFATPKTTVRDAWKAHSMVELMPAMGVMAAGMLVDGGLRLLSAKGAYSGAKAAIDSGKVTFAPVVGPGYFGMDMMFRSPRR